jgi:hypothetical protein
MKAGLMNNFSSPLISNESEDKLNFTVRMRMFEFTVTSLSFLPQVLYSRIAISLWKSSKGLGRNLQMKNTTPMTQTISSNSSYCRYQQKCEKRMLNASESEVRLWEVENDVDCALKREKRALKARFLRDEKSLTFRLLREIYNGD